MKLSKSAIIGVILLLVLAVGAYSLFTGSGQSNFRSKSGFRGLKWGAPLSEHEYAELSDFSIDSMSAHFIKHIAWKEKNFIGNVRLRHVYYSLLIDNGVERFESVEMELSLFPKEKRESVKHQILDILTKEYGNYEEGDSAKSKKYIFENDNVIVHYRPEDGFFGRGLITISSKEMRSRYSKIYEKAEEEAKKKAEKEAKRQKTTDF